MVLASSDIVAWQTNKCIRLVWQFIKESNEIEWNTSCNENKERNATKLSCWDVLKERNEKLISLFWSTIKKNGNESFNKSKQLSFVIIFIIDERPNLLREMRESC